MRFSSSNTIGSFIKVALATHLLTSLPAFAQSPYTAQDQTNSHNTAEPSYQYDDPNQYDSSDNYDGTNQNNPGYSYDNPTQYDPNNGDPNIENQPSYESPDSQDLSAFYDGLSPFGDWYFTETYGYVWIPWVDHTTWRPYVDHGHWVWSDYGWMWVSDYEWGWAPFHYGRWEWVDNHYWIWIPDAVWGPAWVSWRYTDSYVGWSPLPPGAYWYPNVGLELSVSMPWTWWVFLPGVRLLDPYYSTYIVHSSRTSRIYYQSYATTSYTVYNGVPVCLGVDVRHVSVWLGRPVPRVSVSVVTTPTRSVIRAGTISVYRPPVARSVARVTPPPPRVAAPASLRHLAAPPPPRQGVANSQRYKSSSASGNYQKFGTSTTPAQRTAPVNRAGTPTVRPGAPPPAGVRVAPAPGVIPPTSPARPAPPPPATRQLVIEGQTRPNGVNRTDAVQQRQQERRQNAQETIQETSLNKDARASAPPPPAPPRADTRQENLNKAKAARAEELDRVEKSRTNR